MADRWHANLNYDEISAIDVWLTFRFPNELSSILCTINGLDGGFFHQYS